MDNDSLEQPSPFKIVPTCASSGTAPPFQTEDNEFDALTIAVMFCHDEDSPCPKCIANGFVLFKKMKDSGYRKVPVLKVLSDKQITGVIKEIKVRQPIGVAPSNFDYLREIAQAQRDDDQKRIKEG